MAAAVKIVVVLTAIVSTALCLECHICTSAESTKCGDPFVNEGSGQPKTREFIKDCNTGMGKPPPEGQEYKYCRKMYQNVRGEERIIRTCGWEDDEKDRECYKTVLEEYNTYVCSCTDDNCNGAHNHRFSPSLLIALAPAIAAFFLSK